MMKKIVISVLATLALANAQELPYKVFVQTFKDSNSPAIEPVYNQMKNTLQGYDNLRVVKRPSGKFYVVVVETIMEKNKFNDVLKKIKSIPEYSDAFFLPAPELLNEKNGLNKTVASEDEVVQDVKTAQIEEQKEITPINASNNLLDEVENENAPQDVEKVDIDQALAPRNKENQTELSLAKVIDHTLENNPNVKQRVYNYMEVGKSLDIAQRGYYPTLDLVATIGMGRKKSSPNQIIGEKSTWNDTVSKNAELRLVQNLYDGGVITSGVNQAKSRMINASYLVLETSDRISLSTVDAYLNVIKEKTLLDLAAENITNLEAIYEQIKQRSDSGFGILSEKQQAASRLTLAQSNFIAQQNAYDDSIASFEKLTGMIVDAQQLSYPEFVYALPTSLEELESKIYVCNPSIRAENANVELAKELYSSANAAFLPKLDLEGYASYSDEYDEGGRDNFKDQRIDSYGALLRFKYNFFNKGIDMVTKEQRQIGIQKEQEVLDVLKDDLKESSKFSWQSYVLNEKKLGYVIDHAKFSKETLNAYKDEFNIGRRDLINVLDAENEFYNARREIVTTQKDFLYAKYRLLDNMGLLTDSFKPGYGQNYVKGACSIESNL